MLAKVNSAAVVGLDGLVVEVEVDISSGLPSMTIVGLPDTAVQESRERVRSAVRNAGCTFPTRKITVNLAPADLRKAGPAYDLPIAVGILLSSEQISFDTSKVLFLGELSLDGSLRHTHGILPMVSMILGLEGDDEKSSGRIYDFLMRNKIPFAYIFILTPGPNTRLFKRLDKEGRIFTKKWSKYGGDEAVFLPKKMSPEAMERGFWEALSRFYSIGSIFRRFLYPWNLSMRGLYALKFNVLHHISLAHHTHPLRG